ncbi:unnamed protein product [Trichobilharzia szidati]|nr:unnamed protein product [Trichobilharzia szidati]
MNKRDSQRPKNDGQYHGGTNRPVWPKRRNDPNTSGEQDKAKSAVYQSPYSHLVWHQGCDQATDNMDFIATWSTDREINIMSRLKSLIIWPDNTDALGPRIEEMNSQTRFCPAHHVQEVFNYKNQLDNYSVKMTRKSHHCSNPYEDIGSGIFMNRAAMVMANIDSIFDGMFTKAADDDDILYFADICAGPGGFSEYILWRRCNSPYSTASSLNVSSNCCGWSKLTKEPTLSAKGFGMTLSGSCDFQEYNFHAGPMEAFMPHYGVTGDGDITKLPNLDSFASLISRSTNGAGVHVVLGDGSFDFTGQYNFQEILCKQLFVCQCLCALMILRPGGHFLMKLYDTFTEFTTGLIYAMGYLFEEIFIVKPVTSRPANSEKFLICKSLRSTLISMAGSCLPAPKSSVINTPEHVSKRHDTPSGSQKSHQFQAEKTTTSLNNGEDDADKESCSDYDVELNNTKETNPLKFMINYLSQVNKKLENVMSPSNRQKTDVLKVCRSEIMENDVKFMRFMQNMNERITTRECIALSKLITFLNNPHLVEDRKSDLRHSCLMKWQIPAQKRLQIPWPMTDGGRLKLNQYLLLADSRIPLPREYCPHTRLTSINKKDINDQKDWNGRHIGLVCGKPSLTSLFKAAQPMLVYSRGSRNEDKLCTTDGDTWEILSEVIPDLEPRIPAGTLIWGQATNEYCSKTGLRKHALFVYDVLCIYGRDCRQLGYRQRMKVAERMTSVVNFPDMKSSNIRVPPLVHLSQIDDYINGLLPFPLEHPLKYVRMHCFFDGFMFQPHCLLLVEHIKGEWKESVNQSTGKIMDSSKNVIKSAYDLPGSGEPLFKDTRYMEVPWGEEEAVENCTDVTSLVEHLKKLKILGL